MLVAGKTLAPSYLPTANACTATALGVLPTPTISCIPVDILARVPAVLSTTVGPVFTAFAATSACITPTECTIRRKVRFVSESMHDSTTLGPPQQFLVQEPTLDGSVCRSFNNSAQVQLELD